MTDMLVIEAPLALLLLIPLALLAVALGPYLGGVYPNADGVLGTRRLVALTLRCAALCLLIVAIAQPVWQQRSAGAATPVIFVADTSASISPAARAAEVAWLDQALQRLPADAAQGLVTFAGSSSLSPIPAPVSMAWLRARLAAAAGAATNIEQALRLALGALPTGYPQGGVPGGRIVLLTDGVQTAGDVQQVPALAAARHVAIEVVTLPDARPADAALIRLTVPSAVHAGDQVPLQITVWSNRVATATLSVAQDGHSVGSQPVSLRLGDNPFLVNLVAPAPGWHSYHVAIALRGDGVPQNNALDAITEVTSQPRLLVATADPRNSVTAALLRGFGMSVSTVLPRSLPASAKAFASYEAVVLEDLPATDLQARQIAAMDAAVRLNGMGLLVVGGPHSLTLGRYGQTALERMLPVLSDTPNSLQQGNVALQLVLDRSGSMNDLAGEYPKILMAQQAANLGIDFAAQHKDDLGLVSFDYYVHLLVPIQKITPANAARVHAIVNAMTADGGTNIYDALRLGLSQVLGSSAPYKHIILMTDGRSDPANYDPLLAQMQKDQVTLSTIALGSDADTVLLQYLAAQGKGRFYYTNNAADLPRIFAEEARLSAGDARVTGTIGVAINASSPLIRNLTAGGLPPIKGYAATVLKTQAVADLVTQARDRSADPVLAHWQYGLGRVAVWTPGSSASWAATWLTTESTVWNDAVRWLARGPSAATLAPQLQMAGDTSRLVVDTEQNSGVFVNLANLDGDVQAPGGATSHVNLQQVAPGQYEAVLPASGAGVYRITIRALGRSSSPAQATALLAVPYAREYVPSAPDAALLSQIAAQTGGAVITAPGQIGISRTGHGSVTDQDLWWVLAALALLLFVADVAWRQSDWGRAAPPA